MEDNPITNRLDVYVAAMESSDVDKAVSAARKLHYLATKTLDRVKYGFREETGFKRNLIEYLEVCIEMCDIRIELFERFAK